MARTTKLNPEDLQSPGTRSLWHRELFKCKGYYGVTGRYVAECRAACERSKAMPRGMLVEVLHWSPRNTSQTNNMPMLVGLHLFEQIILWRSPNFICLHGPPHFPSNISNLASTSTAAESSLLRSSRATCVPAALWFQNNSAVTHWKMM
jgi:hypothetical protein